VLHVYTQTCYLLDTRVDWQMFNVLPGDQQLIDFVVSYGEPFPKRDADGNVARTPTPPGRSSDYFLVGYYNAKLLP